MTSPTDHSDRSDRSALWMGLLCMLVGLFPILAALHLLPRDPNSADAPDIVIFLSGMVFEFAGAAIICENRTPRLKLVLVALLTALMGSVGLWCAVLAPADGFSGGIPFLPRAVNLVIGRGIFGSGALFCFWISSYIVKKELRTPPNRKRKKH